MIKMARHPSFAPGYTLWRYFIFTITSHNFQPFFLMSAMDEACPRFWQRPSPRSMHHIGDGRSLCGTAPVHCSRGKKKFQKQGLFQVRVQEHTATASSVANVRNVLVYLLLQPFASGPVFGSSTVLPGSPRFYRFLAGCKLHPVTHSFPRVNKWWLPAMTQCSAWLPKLVVTSNSVYHLVADVCKIPTFLVQTPLSVKS